MQVHMKCLGSCSIAVVWTRAVPSLCSLRRVKDKNSITTATSSFDPMMSPQAWSVPAPEGFRVPVKHWALQPASGGQSSELAGAAE